MALPGGFVRSFIGGAVLRGYEEHRGLKAGDILVVTNDSTPGGDTLVMMPCGIRLC